MSSKVDACYAFLEILSDTYRIGPRNARALLIDMKRDEILCITELIVNTLAGNLNISDQPQKDLARFKTMMRKVNRIIEIGLKEEKKITVVEAGNNVKHRWAANRAHNDRAGSSTTRSLSDRTSNSRRTSPSTRQRLRELYIRHYQTVVQFIQLCLPYLQDIINRR